MNQFSPLEDSALSPRPDSEPDTGRLIAVKAPTGRRRPAANGRAAADTKTYLLDTNVLLHNPGCIGRFADNEVCIPVDVLAELDRFKNEPSDRGANARAVHRALTAAFEGEDSSVLEGVATEGGGSLRLVLFEPPAGTRKPAWLARFHRTFPDLDRVDHRIIATALKLQHDRDNPVVLVTKDLNLQLKARAVGLRCEDYRNDKVEASDVSTYDLRRIPVTPNELQRFASSGKLELDPERADAVALNEYVLLEAGEKKTMPARCHAGSILQRLRAPKAVVVPGGTTLHAVNLGQQCFLDALLDPTLALVTCYGHAGTGKTLLAVAAGLHCVFNEGFRGLTVSRPVISMGDTLGYLPGTLDEKMRPWLQPIYDALDFLMPPAALSPTKRKGTRPRSTDAFAAGTSEGTAKPYEPLIEKGVIEIEALCYIRGRSIPHRFFILDEAQQLTPLEAKTVVTRMSKHSKLVMIGDPAQIDNPYVDSRSNGLVYTRNRLRAQAISAHVPLARGERSALAEVGATLM